MNTRSEVLGTKRKKNYFRGIKSMVPLYLFILPGLVLVILFNYIPMAGLQLAFKEWDFSGGIWGSPWVGLDNFKEFVASYDFWKVVANTFSLTLLRFVFTFPAPIVLALMINEISNQRFKRIIQTISYLPHFISWIVVIGFLDALLSVQGGVVNSLLKIIGKEEIMFMASIPWFKPIVIISGIWKDVGWGTILYLAAIAGINPELYEAGSIDGAGKFAKMRHITLPGMVPIISIVLVLSIPSLLRAGVDQIYPMINPVNIEVAEVIDTYVLRLGIGQAQFSVTTAIGLIMSILSTCLLIICNTISKRMGGEGIW